MATTTYQKDDEGNIVDPPVLGDWERRISDAQAAGDDNLVNALQEKYHAERADLVGDMEAADQAEPETSDLAGDDHTDAAELVTNNNYETLRNAARARDLDTRGGKIDLANRIAAHERGDTGDDDTHTPDGTGGTP